MTDNPCAIAAPRYGASGLWVFPVPLGTKMSFKNSRNSSSGERWGATKDPDQIKRDWELWPSANVGIACGKLSGIFVVETDTAAHGQGVDGESALRELIGSRAWPDTLQALSPSGSRHYYFNWPTLMRSGQTIRNSTSKLAPGVDVRAEGGMVIAPPSIKNGVRYVWANKCLINNAPLWLLELLMESERKFVARTGDELVDPWLVRYTMKYVPTELEWNERNNIGLAILNSTAGSLEGFEIWDEWLRRSGKYRPGASWKRWQQMLRCPPNNISYGTLHYRATQANPNYMNEWEKENLAFNRVRMPEENDAAAGED